MHFGFRKLMEITFAYLEKMIRSDELDEMRLMLSDDRLFSYFLSQVVIYVIFSLSLCYV
jgi:hypothetical protein